METQQGSNITGSQLPDKDPSPDLANCTPAELRSIILDVRTPDSTLEEIAHLHYANEEIMKDIVRRPNLSETTLAYIVLTGSDEMKNFISSVRGLDVVMGDATAAENQAAGSKKKLNMTQIILKMNPAQKIKLALTGAKEARGLLIRESSKIIALGVLNNPRVTIGEIETFAKSQNLSEDVIRKIGSNAEWTRKNTVVSALVSNPKTPVAISLGFMMRLSERELGILEKSRSVPEAVRSTARATLIRKKMGKK